MEICKSSYSGYSQDAKVLNLYMTHSLIKKIGEEVSYRSHSSLPVAEGGLQGS